MHDRTVAVPTQAGQMETFITRPQQGGPFPPVVIYMDFWRLREELFDIARRVGTRTDDKEALIKAMRAVSLTDTPRGPFHFDRFGNVVGDFFIRRCENKNGKLVNTTIKTYPAVSQFWSYEEKWFLSQPVYSRDYPPLKT